MIAPSLLKPLYTYPPVSQFVLGGADVMWPGCPIPSGGLGNFKVSALLLSFMLYYISYY